MTNTKFEISDDDLTTSKWDITKYLETKEDKLFILNIALEQGDPVFIAYVLGVLARAEGMALIAEKIGIRRTVLYKELCVKGNPKFTTVLKVFKALGLQLNVKFEKN
jgi:probable addiction module antidote protein